MTVGDMNDRPDDPRPPASPRPRMRWPPAIVLATRRGWRRPVLTRIVGGADAALFTIDAATGALSFLAAPDFEAPGDADGDNVYDVIVSASDGSFTDTQAIAVTVANVNEASDDHLVRRRRYCATVSVAENGWP